MTTILTTSSTLLTSPQRPADHLLDLLGVRRVRRAVATNDRGQVIGQDHPRAKLTDADVQLILNLRAEHIACAVIAEKFGVSVHTVRSISCGRLRSQTITGQRTCRR